MSNKLQSNDHDQAKKALEQAYQMAVRGESPTLPDGLRDSLSEALRNCENSRGVLAVLITLLTKKIVSPKQDIRFHQAGMEGGFSGRALDEKVVTPLLRDWNFPAMKSGSGWLTRSLEQNRPYDLNYPGNMRPPELKTAFLNAVDSAQSNPALARHALVFLLAGLVQWREENDSVRLDRPVGLPIVKIVDRLSRHFSSLQKGASRLPVLAIFAIYEQLTREMRRYEQCQLLPLESHTAADEKTGLLGDVQIVDRDGNPVEAIEIKHNIPVTVDLVNACYAKFRATTVKTFYLLSTSEELRNESRIKARIEEIRQDHGCQVIANGLLASLKYYLRLLKNADAFIVAYANLVEQDRTIPYSLKKEW